MTSPGDIRRAQKTSAAVAQCVTPPAFDILIRIFHAKSVITHASLPRDGDEMAMPRRQIAGQPPRLAPPARLEFHYYATR